MLASFKRLLLGLLLIAGASALLLLSDTGSRIKPASAKSPAAPKSGRTVRVAILQHASQAILDEGREGMLAGLAEQGWVQGHNLEIKLYNAQGDMTVAQAIAKEMTAGRYDLLLSISTVSLQAVANANKASRIPHVFALVTDPSVAGVGISRANPLDHPPYMAGYGTMQPVAASFALAREMNPSLSVVGVVWNAAEANSEAQVKLARQACAQMGIKLIEAPVDNSSGVSEAANSLVARGAQALWLPGDVTVAVAVDALVAAGAKAHIPLFTVLPAQVKRGALFDLGADYSEVGRLAGGLAGEILNGRDPATVPVENKMPEMLTLNLQTLKSLGSGWSIPPPVLQRAQLVIDENGAQRGKNSKKWKIAVVLYSDTSSSEATLDGMKSGWKHSSLVEGRDYEIKVRNAQGDIATLNGILDAALTDGADMVVPLSTPALQAALHKVKDRPIIFGLVANPVAAGAGKTYSDHLPRVTGVSVLSPVKEALDLVQKYFPQYRRFGTLFCPGETNSVDLKDTLAAACRERGLTLEVVAANAPTDLPDAAAALAGRPIDAILQISDNLTSGGFTAIAKAARQAQKPLLSLNSTAVPLGAPLAFGRDYFNSGEVLVALIERVMRGEDPAKIPFILPEKIVCATSDDNARAVGMTLPPGLPR